MTMTFRRSYFNALCLALEGAPERDKHLPAGSWVDGFAQVRAQVCGQKGARCPQEGLKPCMEVRRQARSEWTGGGRTTSNLEHVGALEGMKFASVKQDSWFDSNQRAVY